ncbi:tol-pal system YbgF family protein [Spirochaetota bacterium]
MYHRYKVNKKNRKFVKIIVFFLIVSSVGFFGYRYRQYLLFWRYTNNKLIIKLERASKIEDVNKRKESLLEVIKAFEHYKDGNQVDPEAFFLTGKTYYLLAETYLPSTFTQIIIRGRLNDVGDIQNKFFLKAIKNIKKGRALQKTDKLEGYYSIILAKSCFYSSYYGYKNINRIISGIEEPSILNEIEDKRFYAMVHILNGNIDYGLRFLNEHGVVNESIQGRLFLATSYKIAKKYTNSIMKYKEISNRTSDKDILKLVYLNLGKIYYLQSLYKESLEHFNYALKIDEKDNLLRIWIGKNYSAMGQKDKAKSIWTEVLTSDRSNVEVKKLLGVM